VLAIEKEFDHLDEISLLTLIAISILQRCFPEKECEWQMLVIKAKDFLKGKNLKVEFELEKIIDYPLSNSHK
jgi:hypothetical protein